MIIEKQSILKEHLAFRSFRNQLLNLIADHGDLVSFKQNDTIIKLNGKATDLYFLLDGHVNLLDSKKKNHPFIISKTRSFWLE